jgi:hypothetical protein
MNRSMAKHSIGDRVRVPFGAQKVDAVIVEDRGAIGTGGRRLFAVQIPADPAEPVLIEVPESDIEGDARRQWTFDPSKVANFLKGGGLIAMLRAGLPAGKEPSRVWLRYDTRGNITYTFSEDVGQIGGDKIPLWAIQGERIFLPKVSEVKEWLRTFGLSPSQAQEVINSVGTVP